MVEAAKLGNLMLAIASHPGVKSLGLTKLWKLIYFVDVEALRTFGASITGSEFVKYQHGPVPSRGERILKQLRREERIETRQGQSGKFTQTFITAVDKPGASAFTTEEHKLIDKVLRELGSKTASTLSNLSHKEPAWALAEEMAKLDPELMHYGRSEDPEGL